MSVGSSKHLNGYTCAARGVSLRLFCFVCFGCLQIHATRPSGPAPAAMPPCMPSARLRRRTHRSVDPPLGCSRSIHLMVAQKVDLSEPLGRSTSVDFEGPPAPPRPAPEPSRAAQSTGQPQTQQRGLIYLRLALRLSPTQGSPMPRQVWGGPARRLPSEQMGGTPVGAGREGRREEHPKRTCSLASSRRSRGAWGSLYASKGPESLSKYPQRGVRAVVDTPRRQWAFDKCTARATRLGVLRFKSPAAPRGRGVGGWAGPRGETHWVLLFR